MALNLKNILIGIYVIIVLGFSAFAKADYRILPVPPSQQQHVNKYIGYVTQSVEGKFYLVIDEENEIAYELVGQMDFSQFNGWTVKVLGFENSMHKVGPVLSTQSFDPLIKDDKEETVAIPLLFVTSINGISLRD